MRKSDILKAAKDSLWDGVGFRRNKEKFICLAIEYINTPRDAHDSVRELKRDVTKRLKGADTYGSYLKEIHGTYYVAKLSTRDIQSLRHKLLDEMIVEYESRGE